VRAWRTSRRTSATPSSVAAYDGLLAGLAGTGDEDWTAVLGTNVIGTMHVVSAMAEAMGDRGGSIVLIGSQSSVLPPVVEQLAYASSKGALHAAMFHLAKELGPRRIRVNTVVPTWMWGPPVQMYVQWQVADRGISEEEAVAEITRNMPLGEIPADEDVAESAVFLCSDRARMITGQTLYVNSGEYMT
jgi:NAD(P)-dependent dehydrogenase (short-subunit alcohol dehydrogenase family)